MFLHFWFIHVHWYGTNNSIRNVIIGWCVSFIYIDRLVAPKYALYISYYNGTIWLRGTDQPRGQGSRGVLCQRENDLGSSQTNGGHPTTWGSPWTQVWRHSTGHRHQVVYRQSAIRTFYKYNIIKWSVMYGGWSPPKHTYLLRRNFALLQRNFALLQRNFSLLWRNFAVYSLLIYGEISPH